MAAHRTLDVIQIEDPCPVRFATMAGIGAVRHCSLCKENVYDLSQMTSQEAEELIYEGEGRLCVQFYQRADGTVVTKDCGPVRFAAARRAARWSMMMASGVVAALLAFVFAVAGVFTFWRDSKPEWVVAAKEMVSAGPPMVPVPEPEPLAAPPEPRHIQMRGGIGRRHYRPAPNPIDEL